MNPPDVHGIPNPTATPKARLFSKRQHYLINKKFQYKFILYTFIPSAFSMFLFYSSLHFYFSKSLEQGIAMGLPTEHPYFSLISDQMKFLNTLFLVCGVSSFIFFIIWGIFISHKIAGPLYQQIKFRPGDFFLEIPEAINGWINRSK